MSDHWFEVVVRARHRDCEFPADVLLCVWCEEYAVFVDRPIPHRCPACDYGCEHE